MSSLSAYCHQHLPETLEILRRMVAINSFTENAEGVNLLGTLTARVFAPLGFTASFFPSSRPTYGRHLMLKRAGHPDAPTIALLSHLDTVFPAEEEHRNAFAWRTEGPRVYGPGTNDIKGGTALIHLTLSALRHANRAVFENTNWTILCNASEETDSHHFGRLCRSELPAHTRACLIFEADGSDAPGAFALVTARKGRATFRLEVTGHGAHAGSQHHRGANAVTQLAHTLTRLHHLTDYASGLTVNIGSCVGGTVANRVPHAAQADLEMRAFSPEVYQRARAAILAEAGKGEITSREGLACHTTITVTDETVPWPTNPATEGLLTLWQETGRALGVPVARQERGGLSDGNVLWDHFPTLDGLGPRGDNSHCSERSPDGTKDQEWADATSFAPKAELNASALLRLLGA